MPGRGAAINPGTPAGHLADVADMIDLALCVTSTRVAGSAVFGHPSPGMALRELSASALAG